MHTLWQSHVSNDIVVFRLSLLYVPDNADVFFLSQLSTVGVSSVNKVSITNVAMVYYNSCHVHDRMSCLLWASVAAVVICVSILQWSATEKPVKIDKWDGAAVKNTLDDTSKKVLTCSYCPLVVDHIPNFPHCLPQTQLTKVNPNFSIVSLRLNSQRSPQTSPLSPSDWTHKGQPKLPHCLPQTQLTKVIPNFPIVSLRLN